MNAYSPRLSRCEKRPGRLHPAYHIHDCILRIEAYVQEGRAAFFNDHKTQDAVIRNLEVIGQAVKDLGTERLSAEQPAIPWTQIAGARNVLLKILG